MAHILRPGRPAATPDRRDGRLLRQVAENERAVVAEGKEADDVRVPDSEERLELLAEHAVEALAAEHTVAEHASSPAAASW